ncbi:MAG: DUF2256 domain-containing protein [Verrucomicrobia bacterium]|nr:DUF2256 domain-containing protein [Verrucomicrobiota bacterium]NBS86892.1 DUF2256 domain-containing protein [Verrucomicrobiota bacterium]
MRRDGKSVAKQNLPQKICLRCGRPFSWRKKWERDWDEVKYCSDACRRGKLFVQKGLKT